MASESSPAPFAPTNRPSKSTEDHQADFVALSAKTSVDSAFKAAFIQSKLRLAHTHPVRDIAARNAAVKSVVARLGREASATLNHLIAVGERDQPVPGGVGYGIFYTDAFKTAWGRGTSLAFDIVCPTPPGGNVNTWLYLTATNRSGLGVEAFIAYNGQNDMRFLVFDWARSDHWQTNIPLSGLTNYLTTVSARGHSYQVLSVWNSTWLLSGSTWRNQVLLYNQARGGWDLVYQYDYSGTEAQQKTDWVGSWAGIVETFQPLYSGTNAMGALAMQLLSADDVGKWTDWALLGSTTSSLRIDNLGFNLMFLDPNYSFVVTS